MVNLIFGFSRLIHYSQLSHCYCVLLDWLTTVNRLTTVNLMLLLCFVRLTHLQSCFMLLFWPTDSLQSGCHFVLFTDSFTKVILLFWLINNSQVVFCFVRLIRLNIHHGHASWVMLYFVLLDWFTLCDSLLYCLGIGMYGQCWGCFGKTCLYFFQLFDDISRHGGVQGTNSSHDPLIGTLCLVGTCGSGFACVCVYVLTWSLGEKWSSAYWLIPPPP